MIKVENNIKIGEILCELRKISRMEKPRVSVKRMDDYIWFLTTIMQKNTKIIMRMRDADDVDIEVKEFLINEDDYSEIRIISKDKTIYDLTVFEAMDYRNGTVDKKYGLETSRGMITLIFKSMK